MMLRFDSFDISFGAISFLVGAKIQFVFLVTGTSVEGKVNPIMEPPMIIREWGESGVKENWSNRNCIGVPIRTQAF